VSKGTRMKLADDAFRPRSRHERNVKRVHQASDCRRIGPTSGAKHDEGAPRFREELARLGDDRRGRHRATLKGRPLGTCRDGIRGSAVYGHDQERRSGSCRVGRRSERGESLGCCRATVSDANGGTHDARQHVLDVETLGSAALQKTLPVTRPRDVPANDDHGNTLEVRRGKTGDGVGRPGPGSQQNDRNAPRRPIKPRRLERRGRLVARFDESSAARAEHGVEHSDDRTSRDAEECVRPCLDERLDQVLCGFALDAVGRILYAQRMDSA